MWTVLVLVGCILVGCAEEASEDPGWAEGDSAGIAILESSGPRITDTLRVSGPPRAVIPSEFGAPEDVLYQVRHVLPWQDGGLLVANGGSSRIYHFDGSQSLEAVFGGPGDGPGEFRRLARLFSCGPDSFAAESVGRVTIVDEAGEIVRTARTTGELAEVRAQVVGVDPDCSSILLSAGTSRMPGTDDDLVELPQTIYWADLESGERDTVATVTMGPAQAWELRGRLGWTRPPFAPQTVLATEGRRTWVGLARLPQLRVYGPDGRVEQIVRWGSSTPSLPEEEWNQFERSYENFLAENPREREFVPDLEIYEQPSTIPSYVDLRVGADDRIWIQHYGGYGPFSAIPTALWSVLGPRGQLQARVRMPDRFTPMAFTDSMVIGVARDSLDVEEIHLHLLPEALRGNGPM